MVVSVTKTDILDGKEHDCRHCPVALAINRRLKSDYYCNVDGKVACLYSRSNQALAKHYSLPVAATEFIKRFDKYGDGKSFDFCLDIEPEYLIST